MSALDFFDPGNGNILFMINNKIEKRQRLVQSNSAFGRFRSYGVYNIALKSKQFRKYVNDNGRVSIFSKSKNNTAGFVKHVETGFWILDCD